MYKIVDNTITLTRGDSLYLQINIMMSNQKYEQVNGDIVRFYLKRNLMNPQRTAYRDVEPLITKIIPNDTMILHLEPSDTKNLDFGNYVYDCEITFSNGDVDTFINNQPFIIGEEVG